MSPSVRCRIQGCDLDECGICRRCGEDRQASHDWREATRTEPCHRRLTCARCQAEKTSPDHDWQPVASASGMGDDLKCSRCGLVI